jgi:hypothetical protein
MRKKPSVTLPGTVEKIIPPSSPLEAETVQIRVESADELYREVRIENTLIDETGQRDSLTLGSPVEVTITADPDCTIVQSRTPSFRKPKTRPSA